jgi:aspartyl-tRNA synthetase
MQLFGRSVYCGHINKNLLNKEIFLAGWVHRRRDHGGIIFIDLRDRTGIMQIVIDPQKLGEKQTHSLRVEYVISVRGVVVERSQETINEKLPTGHFELHVDSLSIVNPSDPLPFQLDEAYKVDEELRLKYRYLDLRRESMHNNIKLRHKVVFAIRQYLDSQEFYEIETPILSKSTPEGARDFLVPSRMQPGTFYALPQSPQIYKQLLMASGMDKYFQIARCFRDEDLRANRQPEFSQLDIEMSFVQESDIQNITEGVIATIWRKALNHELEIPFPCIKFDEAFSRFGTDKPDMRFGLEIKDISTLFAETELSFLKNVLAKEGKIGCLLVQEKQFSRSQLDQWVSRTIKEFGAKGLLYVRFNEDGSTDSPVSKFLPDDFFTQAREYFPPITPTSTMFIVAGKYQSAWETLGKLRLALGKSLDLIDKKIFSFLWVTHFPLLEWSKEDKRWQAKHHPFTHPEKEWESRESPGQISSRAYDLVCNGEELGGGSIRIHDADMQKKMFALLGITEQHTQEKFGFLLQAQKLGFPPHGGIALGLDRIIMILGKTNSIRDVIAFPKTQSGAGLMMETPAKVESKQLKELHLKSTYSPSESEPEISTPPEAP